MRALPVILAFLVLAACNGSSLAIIQPSQPTPNVLKCPSGKTQVFQIDSDHTTAAYQVTEQFVSRDLPDTVTGTTNSVQGTIQVCAADPPDLSIPMIQVDLRTLKSDAARRDSSLQTDWLQSNTYPYATFVSTAMQSGPTHYATDQDFAFSLIGQLTIHATTRTQTFAVHGKIGNDGTLTGTATTTLMMADYNIQPPNIAGILAVKDGVTVTLSFTAH